MIHGTRVAERLEALGLTQLEAAELCGLHEKTIHRLVNHQLRYPPRPDTLLRLSIGLRTPMETLLDYTFDYKVTPSRKRKRAA